MRCPQRGGIKEVSKNVKAVLADVQFIFIFKQKNDGDNPNGMCQFEPYLSEIVVHCRP